MLRHDVPGKGARARGRAACLWFVAASCAPLAGASARAARMLRLPDKGLALPSASARAWARQVLCTLLAAAPGSFVALERSWLAAARAVLRAAAGADPGCARACAALDAVAARGAALAAAVNARVLSYDEAEAVQVAARPR